MRPVSPTTILTGSSNRRNRMPSRVLDEGCSRSPTFSSVARSTKIHAGNGGAPWSSGAAVCSKSLMTEQQLFDVIARPYFDSLIDPDTHQSGPVGSGTLRPQLVGSDQGLTRRPAKRCRRAASPGAKRRSRAAIFPSTAIDRDPLAGNGRRYRCGSANSGRRPGELGCMPPLERSRP
jgi:hypothetical protein